MSEKEAGQRSWRRIGCWSIAVVVGLALVTAATLVGVVYLQIQNESQEARTAVQEVPRVGSQTEGSSADPPPAPPTGRIELKISFARLIVSPAEAGDSIRLDTEYDPRYYELHQEREELSGGGWLYRVRFEPGHSLMARLRVQAVAMPKRISLLEMLGVQTQPPTVHLSLPPDVPLQVAGEVDGSFAAMELGRLWLDEVDLQVEKGAVAVSFHEPLRTPMSSLTLVGDQGSIQAVGLGNASPETSLFQQNLGELDLDLRGSWARDADIDVQAYLAIGTVWLPDDLPVDGLEGRLFRSSPPTADEVADPRLRLSLTEHWGRVVFVD
jgi:hypothetical protein